MKVLSIGRNPDCNIVYDDMMVSRRHALIKIYPTGKYEIVSTGTNGTKVNGNLIATNAPYPLKRGDSVTFANVARLDWNIIPNPMRPYYLACLGLLALVIVLIIGLGVSKLVKAYSDGPDKELVVDPDDISVPADSIKSSNGESKEKEDTLNKENRPGWLDANSNQTKSGTTPPVNKKPRAKKNDGAKPAAPAESDTKTKQAPEEKVPSSGWKRR